MNIKNIHIRKKKAITLIVMLNLLFVLLVLNTSYAQSGTPSLSGGCGLLPPSLSQTISTAAPWYCPINQQIYSEWKNYLPLAIISVGIAITLAGIIFMVGVGLKNTKVRNFGMGELYEAIATGLIVGAFLYVSAVIFGLIPSMVVAQLNPYATSLHLISLTITHAEQLYSSLFHTYLYGSFITSLTLKFGFYANAAASPTSAMGSLLNSIIHVPLNIYQILFLAPALEISRLLSDGIIALFAEYYLILFLAVAAIPVFLVPGILFRAFIPTRALGGILMAVGIAFYLVMPIMFSIAYYFTAPTLIQQFSTTQLQIQKLSSNNGFLYNGLSHNSPLVTQLNSISSAISSFWLLIFFYPVMIIAVTYTFIVTIADFIGGSSQTGSRIRGFI